MIHCVSVGELLSMRLLVDRLLAAEPTLHIVITTTTDTGTARAKETYAAPAYVQRVTARALSAGFFAHGQAIFGFRPA